MLKKAELAPFQDFSFFYRTHSPRIFIPRRARHKEFQLLICELTDGGLEAISHNDDISSTETPLTAWIKQRTEAITRDGWQQFTQNHEELARAFCRYLWHMKLPLPREFDQFDYFRQEPLIDDWMYLIEDFASQKLKTSPEIPDQQLYTRIRIAARKLGYAITEQGLRKQASPVIEYLLIVRVKQKR